MAKKKMSPGDGGGIGRERDKDKDKAKNENLTIYLLQSGGSHPRNPTLASAGKNKVRFDNNSDRGLTVLFVKWPFVEAPAPIPVEASTKSKWFNVVPNVPKGSFTYEIIPDLTVGDSAPDPPGVSFNG
jgi:hypothetical protein